MLQYLKTFNSHTKLAGFLAETSDKPIGWLARSQCADIPSPYAYSPTKAVYMWRDKAVVWFEVAHRKFKVFEVVKEPAKTEREAIAINEKAMP